MNDLMIEADGLTKRYEGVLALDRVSMQVRRGEVLGFLGPNGAGKSTTMKMITGFIRPDSGTATVDGIDVTKDPVAVKLPGGAEDEEEDWSEDEEEEKDSDEDDEDEAEESDAGEKAGGGKKPAKKSAPPPKRPRGKR